MKDQRGLQASNASAESLDVYERALRALNRYVGDPVEVVDEVLVAEPDFVMGHVLRGHVHVTLWEKSVRPELESTLATLERLDASSNARERAHAQALRRWAAGDWDGYRSTLDRLLATEPRDLLALQVGHIADFFQGDRDNLRGRVARALPAWTREDPGYGFLHGMHAFGLEECGDYGRAEESARRAIELEPDDCWAQHALAHVMEMQARQAEGIAVMESRREHWAQPDNAFQFHNWWHTALFHLDQGNVERALEIYDQGVRPEPAPFQVMKLDATALLWRAHLLGHDVGERWHELADGYESDDEDGFYAFNDMHAAFAFAATGRLEALARRVRAVEAAAARSDANATMSREVGLPVVRGIEAFAAGRYGEAVDQLMPVRYRAHAFGGSHAQRDILHRTLIEAATRDGDTPLARALADERVSLKPHCPFSWRLRQRLDS